jgi:hypothetical protein
MRYREYAAECLRQASSGKLKTAELWTAILGIVFTAIAYFWSPLGVFMSWLPKAVFVLIFVLLVLFGLVTAPFRMHQNQEEACRRLEEQLDERKRRQRIVDKLAKLHQQCLQLLMRKVDCNDAYISWKQEIEDWYERAQTEIEGSLSFCDRYLYAPVFATFVQPFNTIHQQDLQFFFARYHKLGIIIDDMNTRLR